MSKKRANTEIDIQDITASEMWQREVEIEMVETLSSLLSTSKFIPTGLSDPALECMFDDDELRLIKRKAIEIISRW